ncbi:uncharacterized protein K460DRAFT_271819 [Cucurbitaria berberidis CBS 394.84]|uniref:RCC1/BLIP-II n=1 Tax=Cucurbitaria berberidis CBS 394.84 TaxID=1168544 RepID=A0A9P4GT69_9PLEO|nr:uncharacterized protein K460DRAFT_271819 [Cucurbitaria berberidis CBS 394.84]KAF1852103.1 hypothetical protein K460DRAFT_271819 [Cucurbitaria berberidis CBS 394.84]
MELFTFGVNAQFPPASTLTAEAATILWASWCDVVIASQDHTDLWTVEYRGTGLTAAQKDHLARDEHIKTAVSKDDSTVHFFGGAMHDGLRGYVISSPDASSTKNEIIIFATELEIEEGQPDFQVFPVNESHRIIDINVSSSGDVFLSATNRVTNQAQILHVSCLSDLQRHLASHSPLHCITNSTPLASFIPTQWEINATTSTVLDHEGKVYTSTRDPRYSKCLGRAYEGNSTFEPVPYLSETCVAKVASCGYMSAAVSTDGELFLWGQACPGSTGELGVLKEVDMSEYNGSEVRSVRTGIWAEGEQDDFIKCLTVCIEGEEARVHDVAIGNGHLLVAAQVPGCEDGGKQAVFAAGDNSRGQLGLSTQVGFVEEFEEVLSLRGRCIKQLVAAGWSSFGVANI